MRPATRDDARRRWRRVTRMPDREYRGQSGGPPPARANAASGIRDDQRHAGQVTRAQENAGHAPQEAPTDASRWLAYPARVSAVKQRPSRSALLPGVRREPEASATSRGFRPSRRTPRAGTTPVRTGSKKICDRDPVDVEGLGLLRVLPRVDEVHTQPARVLLPKLLEDRAPWPCTECTCRRRRPRDGARRARRRLAPRSRRAASSASQRDGHGHGQNQGPDDRRDGRQWT